MEAVKKNDWRFAILELTLEEVWDSALEGDSFSEPKQEIWVEESLLSSTGLSYNLDKAQQ